MTITAPAAATIDGVSPGVTHNRMAALESRNYVPDVAHRFALGPARPTTDGIVFEIHEWGHNVGA